MPLGVGLFRLLPMLPLANIFTPLASHSSFARSAPAKFPHPIAPCANTPYAALQMLTKNGPQAPTNTPTRTFTPSPTPQTAGTFVKGININGGAVTIAGNSWLSYANALSQGLAVSGGLPDTKSLTPTPAVDSNTAAMLNSLLYSSSDPGTITLAQSIANGHYQIYLWEMENFQSNSRNFNMSGALEKGGTT
jgi:hypothetical protein